MRTGRRLVALLALPLATCCAAPSGDPGGSAAPDPSPSTSAAVPVLDQPVIVGLEVPWRPEHEQTPEQVREQRRRIQAAQDEVLRALGPHGRLRRELHETAQVALVVDVVGRSVLEDHPRVAAVQADEPAPAG